MPASPYKVTQSSPFYLIMSLLVFHQVLHLILQFRKNRSLKIVHDPRHIEKIYIPHDNGIDFETCILLEPSQQYKGNFLEEIVFQQQLRNELEEMDRTNQIQLTVNTDAALEEIIKKAVKNKKESLAKCNIKCNTP
jgi:hypothetical protein